MKRIAKFEKVSLEQFKKDFKKCENYQENKYTEEEIESIYNNIKIPERATCGSAGYDFMLPIDLNLRKDSECVIPTGIRVKIDNGWVLKIYPRSSLGFKYGIELLNTVGIIDSDYYYSDNEGHIMVKLKHNIGDYRIILSSGINLVQGVFVEYGITEDDNVNNIRNGGIGSTDNNH